MSAAHDWTAFAEACRRDIEAILNGTKRRREVHIRNKALDTARDEVGLYTEEAILNFLANIDESNLHDHKLELLRKFPNEEILKKLLELKVGVDSYCYRAKSGLVYLALWKNPINGMWILKSIKKNLQERIGQAYFNNPFFEELGKLKRNVDDENEI